MKYAMSDTQEVVHILQKQAGILGADIFGSVAKNGCGNDIDMVIFVDEVHVKEWWGVICIFSIELLSICSELCSLLFEYAK